MRDGLAGFLVPEPVLYHAGAHGFALFGAGHVISLALSLAAVVLAVWGYLRLPAGAEDGPSGPRRTMLVALSGASVAIVVAKCGAYVALGLFEPLFWPLHICNLSEFAALGYALSPRSHVGYRLGDLVFYWGTIGCAGALLLPGWHGYCPAQSLASMCGFAEHALVLACSLCMAAGGDYVPELRGVCFSLLVGAVLGAAFRVVNPLMGTNFFFVTNPWAVGGPFAWMANVFGNPGFLLAYIVSSAALWLIAFQGGRWWQRHHAREV